MKTPRSVEEILTVAIDLLRRQEDRDSNIDTRRAISLVGRAREAVERRRTIKCLDAFLFEKREFIGGPWAGQEKKLDFRRERIPCEGGAYVLDGKTEKMVFQKGNCACH
jgi:hypothetical protein